MSSAPELTGDDRLAAEFVLHLLDGDERAEARRRFDGDPAFAGLVWHWEERLSPLVDSVAPERPRAELWSRISDQLGGEAGSDSNVVVALRRKANLWRAYSAGITAVAAALLVVIGLDVARKGPVLQSPQPSQPANVTAATLVASLAGEGGPAALIITYDPQSRSLIATPAVLEGAAGHSHELWVVPKAGSPRSLGIVVAGEPRRLTVPPELLRTVGADATLAVSVEPEGGSPTGLPTGPIIATGTLNRI